MPGHAQAKNLRGGRFCEVGRLYLVTSTVHNREPVFSDFHLGRLVVDEMKRTHDEGLVTSLAWVVMPDHLHWLFELKNSSLAQVMQQTKARSSIKVNKARTSTSPLWQKGYHDRAIRVEEDVMSAARYIICNPIRAGLVARVGDYPLWDAVWVGP